MVAEIVSAADSPQHLLYIVFCQRSTLIQNFIHVFNNTANMFNQADEEEEAGENMEK